jgi:hypothetical protein
MHSVTVITPTTGKASLLKLIDSIESQSLSGIVYHLLLWDDFRDSDVDPASFNSDHRFSIVAPPGSGKNGSAPGSILRAVGFILANTPWITFADDDVTWDNNHLAVLNEVITNSGKNWAFTMRKIWSPAGDYLGIDNFESVGDSPLRRVPYEMCDGNTMIFRREYGVAAAHLYRNTTEYNDDRLMYALLKENAGPGAQTNTATINQICPDKLIDFFKNNCDKTRTIEFYNDYHLGDNVFHLTFLRKLCALTSDKFVYYIKPNYIAELNNHIVGFENRISLRPLSEKTALAMNAWIGEIYFAHPGSSIYDIFYIDWFNYLTNKMYGKSLNLTLISDYLPLSMGTPQYDMLIINSVPQSNQFALNEQLFNEYIVNLSKKYKVITTKKVDGVPCSIDTNMTLIDIGAIAAKVDHVIAIHTGPITTCINQWAVNNVKSWVICDIKNSFSFSNMTWVRNMQELIDVIQNDYLAGKHIT